MDNTVLNDPRMFSVRWMNEPNGNGVRPNCTMIPVEKEDNVLVQTNFNDVPYGNIQSNRNPYAVQHLYTKYGELGTKLGTNLGK